MVKHVNACCGCASPGYPCLGSACPKRNEAVFVCDECEAEVECIYEYNGEQICAECLLKHFDKIG